MSDNRISVLILGGTGAMGTDLVKILAGTEATVTITSRSERRSDKEHVTYLKGDAKDNDFLAEVLKRRWSCVVDFMSYRTDEFKCRSELLLSATDQYIFISSARVYAQSETALTEDSPRLLDVCDDREYLATDEYALAKARQEDILKARISNGNYTIVRPSLTYNADRLQFAMGEKEEWLYRALHGRSIIFPSDMESTRTTMAYGYDVAVALSKLIGNPKAFGQTVHITGPEANTWEEILDIYQETLEVKLGHRAKVFMAGDSLKIAAALGSVYQVKYARRISRTFDCHKLEQIIGKTPPTRVQDGLKICLGNFLDGSCDFKPIHAKNHAYFDRLVGEYTRLDEIPTGKQKLTYAVMRYTPYFKWIQRM